MVLLQPDSTTGVSAQDPVLSHSPRFQMMLLDKDPERPSEETRYDKWRPEAAEGRSGHLGKSVKGVMRSAAPFRVVPEA